MNSLNYIVLLVLVCAAALAFIVIYNLTNINIEERIREIATIDAARIAIALAIFSKVPAFNCV